MTDPEIQDVLRRYRPTGPSPDLRARVLCGATSVGRTWPWAAAAAVLLAATVYLHVSANRIVLRAVDLPTSAEAAAIDALAEMFGGDSRARSMAELVVLTDVVRPDSPAGLVEENGRQ